jgi:hypothetical protein
VEFRPYPPWVAVGWSRLGARGEFLAPNSPLGLPSVLHGAWRISSPLLLGRRARTPLSASTPCAATAVSKQQTPLGVVRGGCRGRGGQKCKGLRWSKGLYPRDVKGVQAREQKIRRDSLALAKKDEELFFVPQGGNADGPLVRRYKQLTSGGVIGMAFGCFGEVASAKPTCTGSSARWRPRWLTSPTAGAPRR